MIYAHIVFVVWAVAVTVTIANLIDTPRLQSMDWPSDLPLVSVIIPARNEAGQIGETIRRFLDQTYPRLEVIVVDDRSSDGTATVARRVGGGDRRLVVVDGADLPSGWLGKPWGLEQGARQSKGGLLLFVDADVWYEPSAVAAMVAFHERSNADLVSCMPHLRMNSLWEHLLMPQFACFIFRFMPLFLSNRSRIPWLALGGGVGMLVRRTTYEANGRHALLRNAIIDDVGLAQLVRKRGGVSRTARAERLVEVRMYRSGRDIVNGFTKNAFAVFGAYHWTAVMIALQLGVHVGPYVLAVMGVGRLLIAATITPLESWGLVTVGLISLTRLILFRAFRYRLDNALLGEVPMALGWSYILARSTWYVGVRKQLAWRGRHYGSSTRYGLD